MYVHVFIVMGVFHCERFGFEYRVVITLLECTGCVLFELCRVVYLLSLLVTTCGLLVLTVDVYVGVSCLVLSYFVTTSLHLGVPVGWCYHTDTGFLL